MAQLTIDQTEGTGGNDDEQNKREYHRYKRDVSPTTAALVTYFVEVLEGENRDRGASGELVRRINSVLEGVNGVNMVKDELAVGQDKGEEGDSFVSRDHFVNHLTSGQDALFRVLLDDAGEWIPSDIVLERMEKRYDHTPGSTRAIGGILAGLKMKYGENNLVDKKNITGRKAYCLNPDYKDELRDALRRSAYNSERGLP